MTILLREQEQAIALKVETTYGTDATPAGANALLAHDITVNSMEGDVSQLNNLVGFLGHQGSSRITSYCSVSFSIYMNNVAGVDTPPAYADVYAISSHAQVITAGTAVDYTLATSNQDSGSIYYMVGEHQHTLLGVRGTISFTRDTKGLPILQFTGLGLYVEPKKVVGGLTGIDFSGVSKPLPWQQDTVPVCSLHGHNLNAAMWSFEQNMPAAYLALIGKNEVVQSNRAATMQLRFREEDISTVNWFALAHENAVGAFSMQHGQNGTHDGDIFEFAAPAAEIANCERSFEEGIAMLTLSCNLVATAKGNDYSFAHR